MKSTLAGPRRLPRVRVVPRSVENDVDEAVLLAAEYGLRPDPWQEDVLESWLGRRRDGRWSASTGGLAVPRQNGKNAVIEIRELYGMAILGERFLHTAHEVKTARKAFLRVLSFFENEREFPELAAMVREIRKTNGQEALLLSNGGGIEFIARSKGSGRGFTVDVLVCDEAQDLSDEELAALLPTISAAPLRNPQVILTGTPPQSGKGLPFRRVREDGEKGRDARLAWSDFGAPDGPLPDLDDRAKWAEWNPALGVRLSEREVERERGLMSDETFAAERAGWWGLGGDGITVMPNWPSLSVATQPPKPLALGVAADIERVWLSLGVCLDGRLPHLGSLLRVRMDQGRDTVLDECERIHRKHGVPVALDKRGPAVGLEPDLLARGVPVLAGAMSDYTGACADLFDRVAAGRVEHGAYAELDAAVAVAGKRAVGDLWAWSRRAGDVSMLEAVTWALWGAGRDESYDLLDSIG